MPKILPPKDRRHKIVRIMVNEAELKAMIKGQKQANFKSLAEYIRATVINKNMA